MKARRLAMGLFAVTLAVVIASLAFGYSVRLPMEDPWWFAVGVVVIALVYTGAGALLAARLPHNPIGWILILIGFLQAANAFGTAYPAFALRRPSFPFADVVAWAGSWTWIPSVGCLVTFLLLLFPDGHPPTPRWRIVGWLAAVGIAVAVAGTMIGLWPVRHAALTDPEATDPLRSGGILVTVGFSIIGVAAIGSIASLVFRFRRASTDERQQLRWFTLAGVVVVVGTFLSFTPFDPSLAVLVVGFFLVPITVALAILKYRLYDLDVVVNKALVYGMLAAFVTAVYVGLVVGVGAAIGAGGNAVLSAVAAAIVALAFQPARRRAQRLANRLVYGRRATPYQVLSEFADRLSGSYSIDDVLPRLARLIAEGTGASDVSVWMRADGGLREVAAWPAKMAGAPSVQGSEDLEGRAFDVKHQGSTLGAVSVSMPANDALTPEQERLVSDVASQAGLVLRNVRLIEELRESRRRIVAAQDERAKKLERDLHDGAQQQLVALAVQLKLVEQAVGTDEERERELVRQLQTAAGEALEQLRDLARGIYPPLLAEQGLRAALEAQARRSAVPVEVDPDSVGRYAQEIESAVYFCTLEALNNVSKYSHATRATIKLEVADGELRFEVSDDGVGFDPDATGYGTGLQGMADRLDAIGGSLRIDSSPGHGTKVEGALPIGRPEARR